MYTTNAYYPSPIDGNFYETYIFLNNGQLTPVHFFQQPNGLSLVYYPLTTWGQAPAPTQVLVSVNNGASNLVYYQPQRFGQTQLLYCTSHMPHHINLMFNPEFQNFIPVNVCDSGLSEVASNSSQTLPCASFIEQNPNRLPVHPNSNIPHEIIQGLQAVQNGQFSNISVNSNHHGFHLTAEDQYGNRIIIEKYNLNGIKHTSETVVETTDMKQARQAQVKQLRLAKMTQSQIANHLGVSQKTISNDLRELGLK